MLKKLVIAASLSRLCSVASLPVATFNRLGTESKLSFARLNRLFWAAPFNSFLGFG